MIVLLLVIIACCLLFGAQATKDGIGAIIGVLCFVLFIVGMAASCSA